MTLRVTDLRAIYEPLPRHSFHKYKITIGQCCLSLCGSAIPSCVRSSMIGSGKKRFQDAIMFTKH